MLLRYVGEDVESGGRGGFLHLVTSAGSAEEVRIDPQGGGEVTHALNERAFAHLLFRSFDDAEERIGAGQDPSLLRMLVPSRTS